MRSTRQQADVSEPLERVLLARPGGSGNVVLTTRERTLRILADRTPANFAKFRTLREQGRVFTVDIGTAAEVIARGDDSRLVRVLEGPRAGRTGWIQAAFTHSFTGQGV